MSKPLKTLRFLFICLGISLLHLSFGNKAVAEKQMAENALAESGKLSPGVSIYDSLMLDQSGLSLDAFVNAKKGWEKLRSQGKLANGSLITIVDFSQSSKSKRLYILDMENYKVLFNTLVAHGKNTGKEWATNFSNRLSSYKSSPGFYVTGETYMGSNGYSLKLDGMENGINDKALQRAIVMHGANYVDESYISSLGFIGRSHGCPAIPVKQAKSIINTIKGGTCLYIHVPDQKYLSHSALLQDSSIS
ncbi:MAG: murein L,D-transpeptidase catalytic domain family protein [Chitinophagaceae bacterium]